jgi:hypothetical protein
MNAAVLLGSWIGVSLTLGALHGFMWWSNERAKLRQQRRADLAHAARELASSDEAYRALGGYMAGDGR